MRHLAALLLLLTACHQEDRPTAERPPVATISTGGVAFSASPKETLPSPRPSKPEPVLVDVIASVCERASCSGEHAEVEVYRAKDGKVGRYVHQGDIGSCSHPPATVFDARGKELGSIPNRPIVPGSPEAEKIEQRRSELIGDHEKAETRDCRGQVP